MDQLSDEELVSSSGDAEAFGRFYRRESTGLFSFFVRRTADAQASADLVAETFAAAFVARKRFQPRGDGSARAWLYGIGRRKLARYLRRQQVSARCRRKLGMERSVIDDDWAQRVDELSDLGDLRDALRSALADLPAAQVDAIRLRVIDALPYREVALRLGCSEGAARVRVARGLARIAEVIGT